MITQGCYELDICETDSDNESHSGSEDGEEHLNVLNAEPVLDPVNIPLPPSPALSVINIPVSEPAQPSAEPDSPVSEPLPSTDPTEHTSVTPIALDAISVIPLQLSAVLNHGAPLSPNDSSHPPIDAQLGDSIDTQPAVAIHSDTTLQHDPTPDLTLHDAADLPLPVEVNNPSADNVDLPTTRSGDNKDGDEPEPCPTDCGRPTLSKIDKGKGREVLIDPTSSSTEPISTSTPTPIPTPVSNEQTNETVCTPPTPSSRTRRSRREKERGHRPKYQPILTIRSSHGWLWNQDLFVPHYMKDRYTTFPPDPYHGHPSAHPSHSHSGSSSNGIQTPAGVEYDCVAIALTAEDLEQMLPP
jgi:hypothetical protein